MKLQIYAIKDEKSTWLSPIFDYNDASAVRNFEHAIKNPESLYNTHPADYNLFHIGEFDSESGMITGSVPEVTILGIDAYHNMCE